MGDKMIKRGHDAIMMDRLENYSAQNYRRIKVKAELTSTEIENVERVAEILEQRGFRRVDLGEVQCHCPEYDPDEEVLHYVYHACGIDLPQVIKQKMHHLTIDFPKKFIEILGTKAKFEEFMDVMWGLDFQTAETLSIIMRLYGVRAVFFNHEGKFCFTQPKDTRREIDQQQLAFLPVIEGHFIVMVR